MRRENLILGPGGADIIAHSPCCAFSDEINRRDVVAFSAFAGLGLASGIMRALGEPADERPKEGDQLVAIDAAEPAALSPSDIRDRQILAWPFKSGTNLVRNGSRLNKIALVRLDPATLVGLTRERAADGVVAYSAICPHAGCEVNDRSAESEAKLSLRGLRSRVHQRANRNHPLSQAQENANRQKSKVRARIEHVFGAQQNSPGGRIVRTIGIARAKAKIGLQNLAYNIRRLVTLEGMAAV